MLDPVVTSRYAEALFNRAQRQGLLDTLEGEARALLGLAESESAPLQRFLASPRIPREKKREIIEKTLSLTEASHLDELALLLLDKGRIRHFRPVLQQFVEMVEAHRGHFRADIATAVDLDDGQRQALRHALEAHTGHRLELTFRTDPALLGGVVFRHRDELLDTSLRSSLDEIGDALSAVRVH